LASDGGLYPINLRTHRVLKKIDIRLTRKTRPLAELFLHGTDLLVVVMPEDNAQMPASLRNAMDIASSQDFSKCELRCFDILTGKEIWHAAAPAFIRAAFFSPTSFNTIQHNGLLVKYNLSDGLVVAEVPTVQAFVNLDCVLLEDGRVVSAGESRLSLLDPRGGPIWTTRTRGARGVTRPAFGALATAGKHLYAGSSDGLVQCLDVEDGALLWKAELNAAVMQLLVSSRYEGMAIAACGDGRMHGIRAGQVVWSLDVNRGRETVVGNQVSRPFSARLVDAGVLIDNPAARQLQLVDPATGRFESHIPCRGAWSAHGSNAVVLSDGIAQIFETAAPRDDR
jgi:outer membrane protein assembly factor BamB